VFAEVKARHVRVGRGGEEGFDERTLGWPSNAQRKRQRLAVRTWLSRQGADLPRAREIRLDIVKVLFDRNDQVLRLEHIEAA
jgi:hypothetical protein